MRNKPPVSWRYLAIWLGMVNNAHRSRVQGAVNVNGGPVGSPATLTCELGQIRKEAAVAGEVCAGM